MSSRSTERVDVQSTEELVEVDAVEQGVQIDPVEDRLDVDLLDDAVDVEDTDHLRGDFLGDGADDLGCAVKDRFEQPEARAPGPSSRARCPGHRPIVGSRGIPDITRSGAT